MQVVKLPRAWYALEPQERTCMWASYDASVSNDPAAAALCRQVDEACQKALGDHLWTWLKTGRDVPSTQIVWTAA
jgi:hypothetical protein